MDADVERLLPCETFFFFKISKLKRFVKVRNRHFFSFFFSRKAAALTKAEQEVDGASLLRILTLLSFFLESSCFFLVIKLLVVNNY